MADSARAQPLRTLRPLPGPEVLVSCPCGFTRPVKWLPVRCKYYPTVLRVYRSLGDEAILYQPPEVGRDYF